MAFHSEMLSFQVGSPFGDAFPLGRALCRQEADSKRITPDKRFIGAKIVNLAIMRGRGLGIFSGMRKVINSIIKRIESCIKVPRQLRENPKDNRTPA